MSNYYSSATIFLSCTVSEILLFISQNLKMSRDLEHILSGESFMPAIMLLGINQHAKFEVLSFTDSKDMTEAPKLKLQNYLLTHTYTSSPWISPGLLTLSGMLR